MDINGKCSGSLQGKTANGTPTTAAQLTAVGDDGPFSVQSGADGAVRAAANHTLQRLHAVRQALRICRNQRGKRGCCALSRQTLQRVLCVGKGGGGSGVGFISLFKSLKQMKKRQRGLRKNNTRSGPRVQHLFRAAQAVVVDVDCVQDVKGVG